MFFRIKNLTSISDNTIKLITTSRAESPPQQFKTKFKKLTSLRESRVKLYCFQTTNVRNNRLSMSGR